MSKTFADEVAFSCELARRLSVEHTGVTAAVFLVRRPGPHTRHNDYFSAGVRFNDARAMFEADGCVFVLHRAFRGGETVPC